MGADGQEGGYLSGAMIWKSTVDAYISAGLARIMVTSSIEAISLQTSRHSIYSVYCADIIYTSYSMTARFQIHCFITDYVITFDTEVMP